MRLMKKLYYQNIFIENKNLIYEEFFRNNKFIINHKNHEEMLHKIF